METYNKLAMYQRHFIRECRDKIAVWIAEPTVEALFAEDMNGTETLWQTHKKEFHRITDQKRKFIESPQGRKWSQKNHEWEQAHLIPVREPQWSDESDERIRLPKPGTRGRPRTPKILTLEPPESPLEKFRLRIQPAALSINDYRVLLGILHDGFTWHEHDKCQYICPELCKKGTIVDMLFWDSLWYEPGYQPLIEEALRLVERDIEERNAEWHKPTADGEKTLDINKAPQENEQSTTLRSFIEIQCDLSARPDVQSKVSLLHEYHRKEKIILPKLAKRYKRGQHKYYYVDDLKKNWTEYQKEMPTLPPLKLPRK